ncbi:chromate transporter [Pseudoramibacter sp.]|jgi:chromate transporter|uniref:chromate transporter n=1 Tax=Pseudoramibacter sp. TaxID=2034862 RepID=UPI0025DA34EF|nr:chromate transporter [Pseudoramibacter sp.]MCH4072779.1 chromate transporter [Pseudoramibacter sp.]MCH4106550.1 chromate transporter [Pseudoramibacter sp.]
MKNKITFSELYLTFFKIGLMMFGGGYAMLPILQREIVENKKWVSEEEIADYYAIGQCTPGAIAVNTATFLGYKKRGILGGIVATLGVISPSLLIIMLLANIISRFAHYPLVVNAFKGIRVAVFILILNSVVKIGKSSIVDKATLLIFIAVLVVSVLTKISPIIPVLAAALLGIVIKIFYRRKERNK